MTTWILGGNGTYDALLILFPGLIGWFVIATCHPSATFVTMYIIMATTFIDTGHVYLTMWRTVCRPSERSSSSTYWLTPLIIVVVVFVWLRSRLPYMWATVVHMSMYHFIRQFFGVLCWYEKLNRRFCPVSNRLIYALTWTPFLLCAFRPRASKPHRVMYTSDDMLSFESPMALRAGLCVYAAILVYWCVFEVRLLRKGIVEVNRLLALASPALLFALCFLHATTYVQMVIPSLVVHGVQYYAIMDVSMQRLWPADDQQHQRMWKAVWVLVVTGLVGSAAQSAYEDALLTSVNNKYTHTPISNTQALLTGVYLAPMISHYVWDAHIWRGNHPDAKLIMRQTSQAAADSKTLV